jgi:hypothetical protein
LFLLQTAKVQSLSVSTENGFILASDHSTDSYFGYMVHNEYAMAASASTRGDYEGT